MLSRFNDQVKQILQNIEKEKNHLEALEDVPIVMFHGDFSFRNMLVDKGKLTGIVDWEWAGAFPVDHEWSNGWEILNEGSEEDKKFIREELDQSNLLTPWREIPFYENRKLLVETIENLAPWAVGCFSEEEDNKIIEKSQQFLTEIIPKLLSAKWE